MATATWNTTSGDWFAAGNWNEPNPAPPPSTLHYVPSAGDDANFNGTGPYTVTYNGVDSVHSIVGAQLVTLAITGGALNVGTGGTGSNSLASLSTVAGSTFAIADNSAVTIAGATTNAGQITLISTGDRTRLTFGLQTTPSPVTLSGGGAVSLSDNANNSIFIDNDASLDNVDNTISGAGAITANFTTLTNEAKGVIDATGTANGLALTVPNVTNKGLLEDTGAGGLQLSSSAISATITNAGGTIAAVGAGAHVDIGFGTSIAGGTLSASGGGVLQVINNANGNILDGTAASGPVTITAGTTLQLNDGSALELAGTASSAGVIVNHGTIALDATTDLTQLTGHGGGTTMLTGGGQITLSDSANNRIGGGDFGTVFDNVDNTISGAGVIDSIAGRLSLTNEAAGIIDATGTNNALSVQNIGVTNKGLLEDTGQAGLTLADATITNVSGTISAAGSGAHVDLVNNGIGATTIVGGMLATSGGGVLDVANGTLSLDGSQGAVTIAGALSGAGTLALSAGTSLFTSGATLATAGLSVASGAQAEIATPLTFAGSLGNNGTVALDGASTLELSGTVGGSGAISFSPGASATLQLDATALPAGQSLANAVGGFAGGDTIDLRGLAFAGNTMPSFNSADGVLTVTEGGVTDTLTLTSTSATSGFSLMADAAGGTEVVVCFATGTRIRTSCSEVAVEELAVGDFVVTASNEHRPIRWIGHRALSGRENGRACALPHDQQPIRIRSGAFGRDAFGADLPRRDLTLSPGHPVLVGADADGEGGVLVPIMCLVNGTTISRVPVPSVTYWHVELDAHDILLAEGMPAESYLDWGDRAFFSDAPDHALANPNFVVPGSGLRCRPVALDGPLVEAERRRLDAVFATALTACCAWDEASIAVA